METNSGWVVKFLFFNVKYNYCTIYLLVVFLSKVFDTKCLNMIIWVVFGMDLPTQVSSFPTCKANVVLESLNFI